MNIKTKVNLKNVMAGVGAGSILIVSLMLGLFSFANVDNENLNQDLSSSGILNIIITKTEKPYTGASFNFILRETATNKEVERISVIGDFPEVHNMYVPGDIQYTLTEEAPNGYITHFQCGILGNDPANYHDKDTKSVSFRVESGKNYRCNVTNTCPEGKKCGFETSQPKRTP